MIFPEWTTANLTLYIVLFIAALGAGPAIYFGQAVLGDDKLRSKGKIPARVGMTFLYSVPILALYLSARDYLPNTNPIQWTVLAVVTIHFVKRVSESLFVHRYSKPSGSLPTFLVASLYSTAAFVIGWLNRAPIPAVDVGFILGILFFVIGIAGNFYHHKLLADLRKNSFDYFIPKGGWFEYVVCPHYLFEIITWLGFAMLSRHLAVWLILLFVIGYLTARGLRTLEWYRQNFSSFPKDRKAILPFIL